jgi:hypothetical protein
MPLLGLRPLLRRTWERSSHYHLQGAAQFIIPCGLTLTKAVRSADAWCSRGNDGGWSRADSSSAVAAMQ